MTLSKNVLIGAPAPVDGEILSACVRGIGNGKGGAKVSPAVDAVERDEVGVLSGNEPLAFRRDIESRSENAVVAIGHHEESGTIVSFDHSYIFDFSL